jgi:hypothetical protein
MKKSGSNIRFIFSNLCLLFFLFPALHANSQPSIDNAVKGSTVESSSIEGVWELTNQFWVKYGDTLFYGPDEIPVKHKIYLDGYVIWTMEPFDESSEWHGYGTYRLSDNFLIEKMVSMSLPMRSELGSENQVTYQIDLKDDYCKQATNKPHRGTTSLFVEEWKKLN